MTRLRTFSFLVALAWLPSAVLQAHHSFAAEFDADKPITLRGTFRAYRLGEAPSRSLIARLMDVFRGCGRR